MKRIDFGSALAITLVGSLWGLNWPAVKFLLTEIPPVSIRALAFPTAAICLVIAARIAQQPLRLERGEWFHATVTGGFLIFGFNVLTSIGQTLEETARATIIAYTMPAMTAVLAAVFLKERLGARQLGAVVIGMAGLGVLLSEDLARLASTPEGPIVMSLAALSWAIGNVALKARTWRTPAIALNVWFFVFSTLMCLPIVVLLEPPWEQSWPGPQVMAAFAFHVLGPMVTCYLLWSLLLQRLSATVAAVSVLIAPVVGVGSSVLLLDNEMSWQKALALVMVIACIALTVTGAPSMDDKKRERA